MTIREAINALVTQSCCHSERPLLCVAIDRIFAKESWVGKTFARRIGSMEHP